MLTSKQGLIIKILLAQNLAGLSQFGKFLKGIFTNWPPFPEVILIWLYYILIKTSDKYSVLIHVQLSNIYKLTRFQRLMIVFFMRPRMVPAFYRYLLPKSIPVLGAGLRIVTYLNNNKLRILVTENLIPHTSNILFYVLRVII